MLLIIKRLGFVVNYIQLYVRCRKSPNIYLCRTRCHRVDVPALERDTLAVTTGTRLENLRRTPRRLNVPLNG